MSSLQSACKRLGVIACAGAISIGAYGQAKFGIEGGEYPIVGSLPGDQVFPQVALNPYGGYIVWQDNATDGDGYGISARRVNRSGSGSLGVFRVNENGSGDQVGSQVALLANGGAIFAWQSVSGPANKVVVRFLKADGTFASGDISVSQQGSRQITPVVTGLVDGNALVVWASDGPDGSMQGVFGCVFSPTGEKKSAEFQVNQTTLYNQRSPAVSALPNGDVVIAWVSELYAAPAQSPGTNPVDSPSGMAPFNVSTFARLYKPNGTPVANEFRVSSDALVCANPCVSGSADGFVVAWTGKPNQIAIVDKKTDGWDIFARPFALDGTPKRAEFKVNSYTYGDQYVPKMACLNGAHFILWTSMGQDGSAEGVVARLMLPSGELVSREFRVNTTVAASQTQPAVASNGGQGFVCVWSSFVGGVASFDLFAQRYSVSQTLGAPAAPYISALSQTRLSVTWPSLDGYTSVEYDLYIDDNPTPVQAQGNQWTVSGLVAGSSHTVRLAYRLADGRASDKSDATIGRTWGEDENFDGIPDDWQAQFWGPDQSKWRPASEDSDGDGATNLQEFLAGTNPVDPNSVLRTIMTTSAQGWRLQWNTEPGCLYQVQSANSDLSWSNVEGARFAAGRTDSIPVPGEVGANFYRVIRLR